MNETRDTGTLLVVDDEAFLGDAVASSLRLLGYEVATAETGRTALQLALNGQFDLAVLDVRLPDFDGFEVLGRLRRDGCRVPVIFVSARSDDDDKVRGIALGGEDFLTKPFGLEELAARVRAVLRRTRGVLQAPALGGTASPARDTRTASDRGEITGPRDSGRGAP